MQQLRNVNISGVVATASGVAHPGDVEDMLHATIAGVVANADGVAPAGTVRVSDGVAGLLAAAIGVAPAGTVLAVRNVTLGGIVAAGTGQAPAGTVSGIRNPTIAGLIAGGIGAAPAGTVTTTRSTAVPGVVATGTGTGYPGTVVADSPVTYDNSTYSDGSGTTNLSLTVVANSTIVVYSAGSQLSAATVDGNAMTFVTHGSSGESTMYVMHGVSAGSHSIQTTRSGSSGHIVSATSYTKTGSVITHSNATTSSGTSVTPSVSPAGSNGIVVGGFNFGASSGEIGSVTSNGDLRVRYRRTSGNCLGVSDRSSTPITLTTPSSGSWTAIGIRLV
ncbi:minor tail protein [Gordonia phage GodonK]|uniref:Minor tail protein n=1 Tax=Gordonia phage GodonK TaxID=2562192 RepID=A0A4D6E432_9CAUD|nr:minor tail protein [Gordonia phage GodonK]QBZ72715.1 minor tail protein [Gordonia phage GodonK]